MTLVCTYDPAYKQTSFEKMDGNDRTDYRSKSLDYNIKSKQGKPGWHYFLIIPVSRIRYQIKFAM